VSRRAQKLHRRQGTAGRALAVGALVAAVAACLACRAQAASAPSPTADAAGVVNNLPVNDAAGPYAGQVGMPVTLAATASDPDNDPLTNEWTYLGPGTCVFSNAASLTSTITCNAPGGYTLALRTDDSNGATTTDIAFVNLA
jgi:hypothetical protein